MVLKNPQTQKALQDAVRAASNAIGGEQVFADEFAKKCIELDLNRFLPDGMKPIEVWKDVKYVSPPKTLFRRLAMKEPERFSFSVDFVGATLPALLAIMPEKIRLNYLNQSLSGLGVSVVSRSEAESSASIDCVRLPAIKEASEAIGAISTLTGASSKEDKQQFIKEANEAVLALQAAMQVVYSGVEQ